VATGFDPRTQITPESFTVAPELLGLPLARPWRRAAAMLGDLIPVAILANAGIFVFLAFLAAVLTWRALSGRRRSDGSLSRSFILPVRFAASLFAFVAVMVVARAVDDDDRRSASNREEVDQDSVAADVATRVQSALAAAGLAGIDLTITANAPERDTIVHRFAVAVVNGDSAAAAELQPQVAAILAAPQLEELTEDMTELQAEVARLERRAEEDAGGVFAWLGSFADDLGIGFGWGALYFTVFLVVGRGQTPGKRLLGVRVIRLDAKPIGWWLAFERFGSYFASISTGMLGFLQIFWDRNRQALHDKAVETVVIRVSRDPAAAAHVPLHARH
jgi:hypothetical protein